MSPCPDEGALAAATTAGLSEDLEAHLDGCAACRQVFAAAVGEGGPSTLGRYELGALIGAGGMGVVYAAYDPKLGRTVALKMLRGQGEAGRERFLREARVMAKLAHPSVVNVFDLGELDERVFIAMEHVEGGTLRRWLASPRSVPEILQRFTQAGEGLAAAHRAGVVHRDFKPENVLLGADGRARVTDFGLANQAPGEALPSEVAVTSTGLHGTPAYMAPEQLRGERVDARADQFAFCVALFEALVGQRPWAGKTVQALRDELEAVTPARPKRDGVPAHVWRAIERGLSRDVEARFPSMDALLFALTHAPRRWPLVLGGVVAVTFVALVALPFVEGPTPTPAVRPMPPAPPRAVVPPKTEMDVLVEPGEAEPLPPAGVEVFLAPGTTRDFRVNASLRVVKVEDPAVLDVDPTPEELTLAGLEVGRTTLTLDFGRERRSWPVTVRKPVALLPEPHPLLVGQRLDVELAGITRVSVGDAKLVELERAPTGLRFVARRAGVTNALVWTRDATLREFRFSVSAADALEVGLQRVLAVERVERVSVDPEDLCEALLLSPDEVLLTPRRGGVGRLRLVHAGQVEEVRELRVSER